MHARALNGNVAGKCSEDAAPQYLQGAWQTWGMPLAGSISGAKQLMQRPVKSSRPSMGQMLVLGAWSGTTDVASLTGSGQNSGSPISELAGDEGRS